MTTTVYYPPGKRKAYAARQYALKKRTRFTTNAMARKGFRRRPSRVGGNYSEVKFADSGLQQSNIALFWLTQNPTTKDCLTAVAQGTGESEHLGRTMYMLSLHLKGSLFFPTQIGSTIPEDDIQARIVIVLDTDTKGQQLIASDVMNTVPLDEFLAFRNLQHTSRLKVLMDRTIIMRANEHNEGVPLKFSHGLHIRKWNFNYTFKKPIRVLFSDTTAVVGSIVDNSVAILTTASSTKIRLLYQCRLRFKDNL